MKKLKLGLLLALLIPLSLSAQSTEAIIDRYFEKIGGKEAFKEFNQAKIEARMNMMGMDMGMFMYMKDPGMQRVEADIMGNKMIQATDGENAWQVNPMAGIHTPTPMPKDQLQTNNLTDDVLLKYGEEGYSFTYSGTELVNGEEAHRLDIVVDGAKQEHFFETASGLRVMTRAYVPEGPMAGQAVETYFGDYDDAGGVLIPYHISVKSGGSEVMSITIIDVDRTSLDDSIFKMPDN